MLAPVLKRAGRCLNMGGWPPRPTASATIRRVKFIGSVSSVFGEADGEDAQSALGHARGFVVQMTTEGSSVEPLRLSSMPSSKSFED